MDHKNEIKELNGKVKLLEEEKYEFGIENNKLNAMFSGTDS